MEITHIGHSCFRIKGKEALLIIDPYDPKIGYKFPKQKADILITTHRHYDHYNIGGVSDYKLHIDGPGEYESLGVFVSGFSTYHDEKQGADRDKNTVYLIEIDGFSILHLGDLGHELPKEIIQELPFIDILMIPVGGCYTIDAETATKVISSIEPGIVIPMHYATPELTGVKDLAPLSKFMDEMGIENDFKKLDRLKVSSKVEIPEKTEVYVLNLEH